MTLTTSYGTIPSRYFAARLPTCHGWAMCSWGYSNGVFFLKYINAMCPFHSGMGEKAPDHESYPTGYVSEKRDKENTRRNVRKTANRRKH